MRGTGTHTFEVKDVFVPEERTVFPYGAPLVSPGPRYKIPLTLGFAAGDGMVALGLARNCINAFFEVAGTKAPRNMQGLLRDQSISQFAVGQAEAALRSGRAFLMAGSARHLGRGDVDGRADGEPGQTHEPAPGGDSRHTARRQDRREPLPVAAARPSSSMATCSSACFTDMHVITQHAQCRLAHYEIVGKHCLGLEIDESRL